MSSMRTRTRWSERISSSFRVRARCGEPLPQSAGEPGPVPFVDAHVARPESQLAWLHLVCGVACAHCGTETAMRDWDTWNKPSNLAKALPMRSCAPLAGRAR